MFFLSLKFQKHQLICCFTCCLQGGKFDHADRLFQSIESTYRNCLSNTSDVKELIPEFFYMPEFLENSNSYHLGIKQDGEPLGDVGLPPWAKVIHCFICVSINILLNNTDNIQLALVHGTVQY